MKMDAVCIRDFNGREESEDFVQVHSDGFVKKFNHIEIDIRSS